MGIARGVSGRRIRANLFITVLSSLLCFGLVGAAAVWDIWKGTALLPGLSGGAAGLASLALAGLLLFDSNWYFLLLEHYRDVHIWHVTPHPDLMQTKMERKNM